MWSGASGSQESLVIPVADDRPVEELAETVNPEITADLLDSLEIRAIEEKYGGCTAEPTDPSSNGEAGLQSDLGGLADYEIKAISRSRQNWIVIDTWTHRLCEAEGQQRFWIRRDGVRLAEGWRRLADRNGDPSTASAADMSALEMAARLEIGGGK